MARLSYPYPVVWILVDLTSFPDSRRQQMEDQHKARVSQARLSVRQNIAGTQALIKVSGWSKEDVPAHSAVLRVFDTTDHDDAVALTSTSEWRESEP